MGFKTVNRREKKILNRLGITYRESAAFILENDELCEKILTERPIPIQDAAIKYGVSQMFIKKLIDKGVLSMFCNKPKKGSKQYIFENELLDYANPKIHYPNDTFKHIKLITNLYINIAKKNLPKRDYNILEKLHKEGIESVSESYDISPTRIRQIEKKMFRRLAHLPLIEKNYYAYSKKLALLKSEYTLVLERKNNIQKRYDISIPRKINGKRYSYYKFKEIKITKIDLSVRSINVLKAMNITNVAEMAMYKKIEFMKVRNMGKKSFKEIEDYLESQGLRFGQYYNMRNKLKTKQNNGRK